MQLTIDSRTGVHNQDIELSGVDVNVACAWLKKLDGEKHTLINLNRIDGCCLMIGGGVANYIVIFDDGKKSLTLKNPKGLSDEMCELCAGGQYGEYTKDLCVDYEQAEHAIKLFFSHEEYKENFL